MTSKWSYFVFANNQFHTSGSVMQNTSLVLPSFSLHFLHMFPATIPSIRCSGLSSFLFQVLYFCTADIYRLKKIDFYCVCQSFSDSKRQFTLAGPLQSKKGSNSYPVRAYCFSFLFLLLAEEDRLFDFCFLVLERF